MLSKNELDFFEKNGFIGPFKLYEPSRAKEILKTIRIKNQERGNILFSNDVNYDRHFDISELTHHISHPDIVNRIKQIIDLEYSKAYRKMEEGTEKYFLIKS